MTDREDDFDRTAKDREGRKVQQELERQLRVWPLCIRKQWLKLQTMPSAPSVILL